MRKTIAIVGVVLFLVLAACSPKTAPAPAPNPQPGPAQSVPAARAPAAAPVSAEDAAWAKTLEAAKKEGKLTIYSYNFVGDIGLAMSRAFKDKYGITVDIVTGRGAEFLERLKTEKRVGNIVGDMTDGSALHLKNMKLDGLTVSVAGELPTLREKGVWVADIFGIDPNDKHVASFNFSIYTPWVNTNLVKPGEEPKTWKDYLDPKWKSKMVLTDFLVSGGAYQYFVPALREKVIDEEFLKALAKQDIRFSAALPDEGGLLARGERAISVRGVDIVFARFAAEGAPIKAIALTDGTVLSAVTTAALKGAPHPAAAKVFINWWLSQEGQSVYGKAASVTSVRKDVADFLPKAAQVTVTRPIILNNEYNEEATKLFREKWLAKLWGQQ
ncbi:MAG: extracellular solute-binding protein [Chloroflexi bacterium]|nr:extracellular solute-binding protein [Chloroflexota bacterium]